MPIVEFEGKRFDFPNGTTQDEMTEVLESYSASVPASVSVGKGDSDAALRTEEAGLVQESYFQEGEAANATLPRLDANQQRFVDAIAHVETGGLDNRFIRTKERPTEGNAGSSAYGTYQITHGLLSGYVNKGVVNFSEPELAAAKELLTRQKVSLAIGGRDRTKYQKGGSKHALGVMWAKQYGYEDVEQFLNDFDYGGNLGLEDDGEFQMLYESFGRKMLLQHLKDADGNAEKAAAIWHGGLKGAGKKTENYVRKFRNAYGTGEEG